MFQTIKVRLNSIRNQGNNHSVLCLIAAVLCHCILCFSLTVVNLACICQESQHSDSKHLTFMNVFYGHTSQNFQSGEENLRFSSLRNSSSFFSLSHLISSCRHVTGHLSATEIPTAQLASRSSTIDCVPSSFLQRNISIARMIRSTLSTFKPASRAVARANGAIRTMAGKEIKFGVEGRAAMLRGVNLLADAVQVRFRDNSHFGIPHARSECTSSDLREGIQLWNLFFFLTNTFLFFSNFFFDCTHFTFDR